MVGKVHSIQTLGTLDGPGVRFVVFMQGCPLRCKYCHNPDTWAFDGGKEYSPKDLLEKAVKYKEYFGKEGGITVSGGEPLLQADFVYELFLLCKQNGINTCLDTSGVFLNEKVKKLLSVTDRVLLDVKFTTVADYRNNVGCGIDQPLSFLDYLKQKCIPTTIRQVIVPTLNDSKEQVLRLKEVVDSHSNVDKVELLPFKKMCMTKYEGMGIDFPLASIDEPSCELMSSLEELINNNG